MVYCVLCILPSNRRLFYSKYKVVEDVKDADSPSDRGRAFLRGELVSLDDLSSQLGFAYSSTLIFLSERDFRDMMTLSPHDCSDDDNTEDFIRAIPTEWLAVEFIDEFIGFGLFAAQDIDEGLIIGEYTGIITRDQRKASAERCMDYSLYYPGLDGSLEVDAREFGSLTRFINHSSSPNTAFEPVYTEGILPHVICVSNRIQYVMRN